MAAIVALLAISIEEVVVFLNPSKNNSIKKAAVLKLNFVDKAIAVTDWANRAGSKVLLLIENVSLSLSFI